ncbi:MAG TPA: hypothetical protein VFW62_01780, partial [bacterium]|nr:hypothetical protein [bacterium]
MAGWVADAPGRALPSYELIDLGFLACEFPSVLCDSSEAVAINQIGTVAGMVEIPEPHCNHAAIYRDGAWLDLGVLGVPPGEVTPSSFAADLNNRDQVAGTSMTENIPPPGLSFVFRAFFWDEDTGMRDLGALGRFTECFVFEGEEFCFTNDFSWATAVNDQGQVVGSTSTEDSPSRAFLWDEDEGMRDLGALSGSYKGQSDAVDINNRGEVLGNSGGRAFLYANGVMRDLDETLPFSEAIAINDAGQVLLRIAGRPYLWHNGKKKLLEPLPGDFAATPISLNNRGQVVGESYGACPGSCSIRPVLWDGE